MNKRNTQSGAVRTIKKSLLSAFLLTSFGAYAVHSRAAAVDPLMAAVSPTPAAVAMIGGSSAAASASTAPSSTPTATDAPATTTGSYKNGTYTGPVVNVNWGNVQVEATIQGGKIANVQFLQYPNERNTSVRINSFAVPQLQQEAIQAQSANVDIVTGATLTSEGFQQSLGYALSQAQG